MDNLVLVAVIIIVLWSAAIGYYFYLSRQQRDLGDEIQKLRDMLGTGEGKGESD